MLPRPITVDTSAEVLIYVCPRPATDDTMKSGFIEDVYPNEPRPAKDDWRTLLLMYNSPRPSIVDVRVCPRVAELMYTSPKPSMLDCRAEVLI